LSAGLVPSNPRPQFRISSLAERDIAIILEWTHEHFGEDARTRYEALLEQALIDVAADPQRAGTLARPEIARFAMTYHLRHSRVRVKPASERVRRPRHYLLYRSGPDGVVEIARVLHDEMDLKRHLPEDYRL
jgi:toxin ParE1/3/4